MAKLLVNILSIIFLCLVPINGIINDNFLHPEHKESPEETIRKSHLIRHVATSKCLVLENLQQDANSKAVLWDCFDRLNNGLDSEMYVMVKSNGGGYLIMGSAGSADKCLYAGEEYYDPLVTYNCDPDNANLSWMPRKIDGTTDMYQMVQKSTGRCLRAPGRKNGVWVRAGDCDVNDSEQSWRICKYDGTCDF